MVHTVEIFYSFQCPYSYLAMDRLSQISAKYDVSVLWQPYSSRVRAAGDKAPSQPSERVTYAREDAPRMARSMNMPLVMPEEWPGEYFDGDKIVRGALAASELGVIMEYNIKVFHRMWGEGLDPTEQTFLMELCDDLDINPNEFAGRMSTSEIRSRVRGNFNRSRKLGVFDTPMVLINDERFHGLDRIDQIEEKLKELGTVKPAWV